MPMFPGLSRGMQAMFTVSFRLKEASWQEALSAPDHMWVTVGDSVVKDGFSCHGMYGIGAEQGQLIIMNTLGSLDLRAIDESWLRNSRVLCF
mmetsp:Transcript_152403/g.486964  ORF Transcript_152403/g.486964 Transcript_152403/m.486964 type:complete len:92 (-) Transcript_152403:106-381(-)